MYLELIKFMIIVILFAFVCDIQSFSYVQILWDTCIDERLRYL